ncbi:MAG: cytochrome c3 family protein [Desulfuromonadaceae bacterium]
MQLFPPRTINGWLLLLFLGLVWFTPAFSAVAASYPESAHGNATDGVNAAAIESNLGAYATGNCAHCHQMHASMEGVEPNPVDGPAPHALFTASFNTARTENPYLETDNFCFACHSGFGQQVVNQDYSVVFGGATNGTGPQSILTAFNQASYHNLRDIVTLLGANPTTYGWFGTVGNPCSACHNSHLAKANWDSSRTGFPLLSAISRPDNHTSLWGETELMQSYSAYEAPYAFDTLREPDGVVATDGSKTPDYPGFCTGCHNPDTGIWSTSLNRELKRLNWGISGTQRDKHGPLARDGEVQLREPYARVAGGKSNFVLSCLDCHEAHGSENSMLLRRRINGENLEGVLSSTDAMSYACKRCHLDDLAAAAGTMTADRGEYVPHKSSGAPDVQRACGTCHPAGTGGNDTPIACGNCHGHGMNDSWAGGSQSGRQTF